MFNLEEKFTEYNDLCNKHEIILKNIKKTRNDISEYCNNYILDYLKNSNRIFVDENNCYYVTKNPNIYFMVSSIYDIGFHMVLLNSQYNKKYHKITFNYITPDSVALINKYSNNKEYTTKTSEIITPQQFIEKYIKDWDSNVDDLTRIQDA